MPRRATPPPPDDSDAPREAPATARAPGASKAAKAKPAAVGVREVPAPPPKPAASTVKAVVAVPKATTSRAAPKAGTPKVAAAPPASPQPAAPEVAAKQASPAKAAAPRKTPVRAAKPIVAAPAVPAAVAPARQGPPRRTAHLAPAGALRPAVIPREALVAPRRDRFLVYAIGISVLLHLVLLMIHFKPFESKRSEDKSPPIEVALVNAKSVAKPDKADVLAQANLDGGGNTDEKRRAKSPLPVLPRQSNDQQIAVATQRVEELEEKTRELLTALKSAPLPQSLQQPTEANEKANLPTSRELMQRTLEAMKLEAQIAKDMDAYQKRPKRQFVGARAEEYRFARYVEDWRLKIERIGNMNYPEAARQQKLYGSLLLSVAIRSDGSLEKVEVLRTSGSRILDAAAVKIVEMSAPFAAFPPDIKRDTDILEIKRTWTFTKADSLESQ